MHSVLRSGGALIRLHLLLYLRRPFGVVGTSIGKGHRTVRECSERRTRSAGKRCQVDMTQHQRDAHKGEDEILNGI